MLAIENSNFFQLSKHLKRSTATAARLFKSFCFFPTLRYEIPESFSNKELGFVLIANRARAREEEEARGSKEAFSRACLRRCFVPKYSFVPAGPPARAPQLGCFFHPYVGPCSGCVLSSGEESGGVDSLAEDGRGRLEVHDPVREPLLSSSDRILSSDRRLVKATPVCSLGGGGGESREGESAEKSETHS